MSSLDRRTLVTGLAAGLTTGTLGLKTDRADAVGLPLKGPVRLIVPAAPETRHSLSARLFAQVFARILNQPVEVVNPRNTPALALGVIADSDPDGQTLGFTTMDLTILHWLGQTGVDLNAIRPLGLINEDPAAVFVRADSPYRTLEDLVAQIKARPGLLRASSTPARGIWHLSTVAWLNDLGLDGKALTWVPSRNPAAALQDMMQDGNDVIVCGLPFVLYTPFADRVRALGVMAHEPLATFPAVPTMQRAIGRNFASGAWRGLVAPKAIDPYMASAITAAAHRAWESEEFQTAMNERGFAHVWRGEGDFGRYIAGIDSRMGEALRVIGAT